MKLGILQCDHVPSELLGEHGDYDQFFIDLLSDEKFEFATYSVVDGIFPDSTSEADGWVITGGKYSVSDTHAWISRLKQFVREAHDARAPMVGVCFGHQVIAEALGGTVGKSKAGWTAGPVAYRRNDHTAEHVALTWHEEEITELPENARVVGASDRCEYAILRYGDTMLSYQGHPEIKPAFLIDLLAIQGEVLPKAAQENVLRSNETTSSTSEFVQEIKELFLANPAARATASCGRI